VENQILIAFLLSILAGLSTTIGSAIAFFIRKFKPIYLYLGMGFSAGVMIFISFMELLSLSIAKIGLSYALIAFFSGIFVIYLIDIIVPHTYEKEKGNHNSNLKRLGLFVALGIAIHNFPEGFAVFFSSLVEIKLGLLIAVAIALHNIPEGIAVALPIYYATKSKAKAFYFSFLSGIAEPIGAFLGYFILFPFITQFILYLILSAVAGIMIFISFDELLPFALKSRRRHTVILGVLFGMLVAALSLFLIR